MLEVGVLSENMVLASCNTDSAVLIEGGRQFLKRLEPGWIVEKVSSRLLIWEPLLFHGAYGAPCRVFQRNNTLEVFCGIVRGDIAIQDISEQLSSFPKTLNFVESGD